MIFQSFEKKIKYGNKYAERNGNLLKRICVVPLINHFNIYPKFGYPITRPNTKHYPLKQPLLPDYVT